MIVPILTLLLSVVWAGLVADMVYESAKFDGAVIVMFDRIVGEPGLPEGIWLLCGMAASAGLAFAAAVGILRRRRLERRMTDERDGLDQISQRAVGDAARAQLLQHRLVELQQSLDKLVAKRDASYEEMRSYMHRTKDLDALLRQQREALEQLAGTSDPSVVRIPHLPEEVQQPTETSEGDEVHIVEERADSN